MNERPHRPTGRSLRGAVIAVLLVGALGACGTSGGGESSTETTRPAATTSAPNETTVVGGGDAAFCEAFAAATRMRSEETDPAESWSAYIADLETALAVAPEPVAEDLEAYVTWGQTWSPTGDAVEPPPPGTLDSFEAVANWATENC